MEIEVCLAKSTKDIEAAYKLVYESYLKMGYIDENSLQMHIRPWNLLPTNYVIIAKFKSKIIGTLICIVDSSDGIPLDNVVKKQICQLRTNKRNFCELSSLVCNSKYCNNNVALQLFRYAFKLAAEHLLLSDFIIGVNPNHEKYYKSILFFDTLQSNISYSDMNNNPVTVLITDLKKLEPKFKERYHNRVGKSKLYDFFFIEQKQCLKNQIKNDFESYQKLIAEGLFNQIREEYNNSTI